MAIPAERLPCIGVVLAGGRSSRMGRDKALLDWHGRALIDHQLERLARAGVDATLVSGTRPGHAGIADTVPGLGPLGGLSAIAAVCPQDCQWLIVPVDMPRLTATLLHALRTCKPDAACLRFCGHVLPMRLRLDRRSRDTLASLLADDTPGARSLRALQQALQADELALPAAEADCLIDCNTPEHWKEALP